MILVTRQCTSLYRALRIRLPQIRRCVTESCMPPTGLPSSISRPLVETQSAPVIDCRQSKHPFASQTRHYTSGKPLLCCPLSSRILVKMKGKDAADFLQGLITNDIRLLNNDQTAIYTMMLNVQGRVLYDMIIYMIPPEDGESGYLIECDKQLSTELIQNMNKFKIRKKVTLSVAGDQYKLWAVFPPDVEKGNTLTLRKEKNIIISVPDPRLPHFCHRIITEGDKIVSDVLAENHVLCDEKTYDKRRYIVGLSEGPLDLPPGNCTPLESNAVFLNGVSFSKGCYLGQELTARTHHTGVIRKRLMPVIIHGNSTELKPGMTIENSKAKNCGKYRNGIDSNGLALLRLQEAIGKDNLVVKDEKGETVAEIEASIPWWWPTESDEVIKQILTTARKS